LVTPEFVAEAMVKLMEDDELVGGTILEVGYNSQRIVPLLNNPGPQGEGHSTSNHSLLVEDVYKWLGTEDWGKF
jgi:hypothetical protein